MSDPDDLFGDDAEGDELEQEVERHRDALNEHLCDFMEEEDLSEAYLVDLLADAMVRMRMIAYGIDVEKPSVAGLKMDLDRLRDELGVVLRDAKKGAEEYIEKVKEARAEIEAEEKAAAEAGESEDEGDEDEEVEDGEIEDQNNEKERK
jgi:hypothetical protein